MQIIRYQAQTGMRRMAAGGVLASALSAGVLVWRGRNDGGSGAGPINAISHWLWPVKALHREDVSAKHTLTGLALHTGSSLLWAWVFTRVHALHQQPTVANAVCDAGLVTALAAVVDLKLVPDRLSPGFQKVLHPTSTALVYVGFAAGLALAGMWANRRPRLGARSD